MPAGDSDITSGLSRGEPMALLQSSPWEVMPRGDVKYEEGDE